MSKFFKTTLIVLVVFFMLFLYALFIVKPSEQKNITWGVNFSQMQTEALKLEWKKVYLAILEDLGTQHIKLHTQWDFVEGTTSGDYYFNDIDWQLEQAKKHNVDIIYVVGMKTGRWPECHVPSWAKKLSKKEQQDSILHYLKEVVIRYKNNGAIVAWQAENEPFFNFGICPWYDADFLKKEVALIKSIDNTRPVVISDSGEQSMWLKAAKLGDIVGFTTYRRAWFHINNKIGFYINFPIPPIVYWYKAKLVQSFFSKKVIGVELQAEPWINGSFHEVPLFEQEKTMNLLKFKNNIQYARATGLDTFYLWGAEWMYWLKESKQNPEIWDEAKKLFM